MKYRPMTMKELGSHVTSHTRDRRPTRGKLTVSVNGMHRAELRGTWHIDPERVIFHNLIRFHLPWADFWLEVKDLRFHVEGDRLLAVTPGPIPYLFWNPKGDIID